MIDAGVIAERERLCALFSLYGAVLPETQRRVMHLRVNEDLSLQEIADLHKTSRQAVHVAVKAALGHLEELESQLGFLARGEMRRKVVERLKNAISHGEMQRLVRENEDVLEA